MLCHSTQNERPRVAKIKNHFSNNILLTVRRRQRVTAAARKVWARDWIICRRECQGLIKRLEVSSCYWKYFRMTCWRWSNQLQRRCAARRPHTGVCGASATINAASRRSISNLFDIYCIFSTYSPRIAGHLTRAFITADVYKRGRRRL